MIELDDKELKAIGAVIGPVHSIKSIYPEWKTLAGWGGMTQPGVVQGQSGRFKIVALQRKYRKDPAYLERLSNRVTTYKSLSGCRALPRLLYHDDFCMVTEWLEGKLLSKIQLTGDDLDGLAKSVSQTYSRMQLVPNPWTPDDLMRQVEDLRSAGRVPEGTRERVQLFLAHAAAPSHVLKGSCFGDVALKNFVRQSSGEIGYIDTMGVSAGEMPINVAKIVRSLGPDRGERFLERLGLHGAGLPERSYGEPFFDLVLCLRQISVKSVGGRGIMALLRRRRAKAAARRLQSLLESQSA